MVFLNTRCSYKKFLFCFIAVTLYNSLFSQANRGELKFELEITGGYASFVENCNIIEGRLNLTLDATLEKPRVYSVDYAGTAVNEIDYKSEIPDVVTFEISPGPQTLSFPINVIVDGDLEIVEDFSINFREIDGADVSISPDYLIYETVPLNITEGDEVSICKGGTVILNATGADEYFWTSAADLTILTPSQVSLTPDSDVNVYVEGILGSCKVTDSVQVLINDVTVQLESDKTILCGTETIKLNTVVSEAGGTFTWLPASLFSNQNTPDQIVPVSEDTEVIVSYTLDDCTVSDTINITLLAGTKFTQTFTDTIICGKQSLAFGDFTEAPLYSISPLTFVDLSDPNRPLAAPDESIVYTVTIQSEDNSCAREYIYNVVRHESNLELLTADSVLICLGDSTLVRYTFEPNNGSSVVWTPNDTTFHQVDNNSFIAKPTVTTVYTGTFTSDVCTYTVRVKVRVDSIPEIPLDRFWPKDFYCEGEIVNFISPSYDSLDFPDITFNWLNPLGGVEPFDNLNLSVITRDTFLYTRITNNGACVREDTLTLYVIESNVPLSLNDTTVCPNEPVPVTVQTNAELEEVTWTPEEGVSCNDCLSVIITTASSNTFMVEAEVNGCPVSGSVRINVDQPVLALSPSSAAVCPNEPITVSVVTPATNLSWSPSQGLSCTNCSTTVVTTSEPVTYTVTGNAGQYNCPAEGSVTINIVPATTFQMTVEPAGAAAIGTSVTVSVVNPEPGARYNWFINGKPLGEGGSSMDIILESESDLVTASKVPGTGGFCLSNGEITLQGVRPYLDLPNVFTPNNDMKNDIFRAILPSGVVVRELLVINRWGQQVFQEEDGNEGWDGNFSGKEAPSDTYLFKVRYQLAEGGIIEEKRGEVVLLR